MYCRDPHRDHATICVVEEPHNIFRLRPRARFTAFITCCTALFRRLRGIGPEQLRIKGLIDRMHKGDVTGSHHRHQSNRGRRSHGCLFIAPDEAVGPRVTRIAMGIPVGSDLEFADEVTMSRVLENRREM